MATKISTLDSNVQSSQSQKEEVNSTSVQTEAEVVPVPPAGRAMSFEEAKAWALKKYDSALRELAK